MTNITKYGQRGRAEFRPLGTALTSAGALALLALLVPAPAQGWTMGSMTLGGVIDSPGAPIQLAASDGGGSDADSGSGDAGAGTEGAIGDAVGGALGAVGDAVEGTTDAVSGEDTGEDTGSVGDTAPTDTSPSNTAPSDTAPSDTAPSDTGTGVGGTDDTGGTGTATDSAEDSGEEDSGESDTAAAGGADRGTAEAPPLYRLPGATAAVRGPLWPRGHPGVSEANWAPDRDDSAAGVSSW